MRSDNYFRICDKNETLYDAMAEALKHDAALYIRRGIYLISSEPVRNARQVAPIFQPIKPLQTVNERSL